MADFGDKFKALMDSFAKASDAFTKVGLYPPGFEQQAPAYQMAWIDQQIPLLEKCITDLEAQAQRAASAAAGVKILPKSKTTDWLEELQNDFAQMAQESAEQLPLATAREQLVELKSRKAALTAALPVPSTSAPAQPLPPPTKAQRQATKLAEIAQLQKDRQAALATTNDPNLQAQFNNMFDDARQRLMDEYRKLI